MAQPIPIQTKDSQPVNELVLSAVRAFKPEGFTQDELAAFVAAVEKRIEEGIEAYKTPLMTFNGLPPKVEAKNEGLDGIQYSIQGIEESRVTGNRRASAAFAQAAVWFSMATLMIMRAGAYIEEGEANES